MFWLPHIATSESVGLRCGPNLAVFVPVFWCPLCRRPLAGGGLGCVAPQGLGGCSTDDVHRQQLDQLPPVVLRPVRLDDVPPTTKEADPASYIAGGRGRRLVEQSRDRLGRCFLHAASYNVIITASIPRELPQHLESQLEWGERGGRGNAMGRSTRTQRQLKRYNFVNSN